MNFFEIFLSEKLQRSVVVVITSWLVLKGIVSLIGEHFGITSSMLSENITVIKYSPILDSFLNE